MFHQIEKNNALKYFSLVKGLTTVFTKTLFAKSTMWVIMLKPELC